MDENLNTAAVTEDTTPQTETVEEADTPSVLENVDNPTTEPQTDTTPEADGGEENPQPPVEPFLTAKFNHKDVDLTREQTLAYAQKGMKYDEEKMQADIEKYGLFTYEELSEYLTLEQFNALPFQYFKVSIGKGLMTWDEMIYCIEYVTNIIESS